MRTLKTRDALNTQLESMERKAANLIAKNKRSNSKKVVNAAAMLERIFAGTTISTQTQKVA